MEDGLVFMIKIKIPDIVFGTTPQGEKTSANISTVIHITIIGEYTV